MLEDYHMLNENDDFLPLSQVSTNSKNSKKLNNDFLPFSQQSTNSQTSKKIKLLCNEVTNIYANADEITDFNFFTD